MAYYLSAYAIAVVHGFRGSETQWLASLKGAPGKSAYEVAVECGFVGTKEEWLETLKGETDLPVALAAAAAPTGYDTYAAAGDNLPVVQKASGQTEAVGVGKQIVFLPSRANLTTAPVLKLNNGETVEVRLRADGETADTVPVPVGALKAGVPVTLTFGGTYWLVDSAIGGLGGGNAERVELTQTVTIGETECDNVQDALEAAADALENKIDEEDVEKVPFVTASDALQQVTNDTAPITPAGVKKIVDEYGVDAQNIKVFDLDDVSYAALFAATEDAKTAIFLAYNVGNYQPDPEEEVYPYDPTLLILKMKGFTAGVGATFEQDADLVTYNDDDTPMAVTVRRTVRVTVAPGATVGAADVITEEITKTQAQKLLPPPIPLDINYTIADAVEFVANQTASTVGDIIKRTVSGGTLYYVCTTNSTAGTWSSVKNNYTMIAATCEGTEREYDATKTYAAADKCFYSPSGNGAQHMYACKIGGTVGVLPTDTTKWIDLGAAFAVDPAVDFRKYEDAFAAGLARILCGMTFVHQSVYNSVQPYVEFHLAALAGYQTFGIIFDRSTGAVTKKNYTAFPYPGA